MHVVVLALRLLAAILGTASVMLAWSEFVFFNEDPAKNLIAAMDRGVFSAIPYVWEMVVFYIIPGAFLVGLVGLFGSRGPSRVLLLGALTGLCIEGAVVPAVYEAVPFSYLWTSVAWHGPVTVGLGVFLLPRLLARASILQMALVSVLLGVCWAVWTTWPWGAGTFEALSLGAFAWFAGATTVLMVVGLGALHGAGWPEMRPKRWVCALLIFPSLALFVLQGVAVPLFAVGVFVILGGLVWLLQRQGAVVEAAHNVQWPNLAALLLMPLASIATYGVLLEAGAPLASEDLVALAFFLGMGVWLWGLWRGRRRAA